MNRDWTHRPNYGLLIPLVIAAALFGSLFLVAW